MVAVIAWITPFMPSSTVDGPWFPLLGAAIQLREAGCPERRGSHPSPSGSHPTLRSRSDPDERCSPCPWACPRNWGAPGSDLPCGLSLIHCCVAGVGFAPTFFGL